MGASDVRQAARQSGDHHGRDERDGEATARVFAKEGATLLLAGRAHKGEALARELGGPTAFQVADVTREADIAALVDAAVAKYGRLDCLFNNAGAATPGTIDTMTEQDLAAGFSCSSVVSSWA